MLIFRRANVSHSGAVKGEMRVLIKACRALSVGTVVLTGRNSIGTGGEASYQTIEYSIVANFQILYNSLGHTQTNTQTHTHRHTYTHTHKHTHTDKGNVS